MGARAPPIPDASDFRGATPDYEDGELPPLPTHPGKVFIASNGPSMDDLLAAGSSRGSTSWGSQASLASMADAEGAGMSRHQKRSRQQQERAAQAAREGAVPKTSTPQAAPSPPVKGTAQGLQEPAEGEGSDAALYQQQV